MPIEDVKPGDVLRGCTRITNFLRVLLDDETIREPQVYHWLEEQFIPNKKFGGQITTTKPVVIAAFVPAVRDPATVEPSAPPRGRKPEPQRRRRT